MMLLSEIFKGAPAIDIKTLAIDSRKDMTDGIFFCIKGFRTDGHRFIKDAIHNGAKAIVYHDEIDTSEKAVYIKVDDVIKVMNQVIKKFYNDPSEKMEMYAVTGTNGKTTIATLIKELIDIDEPCGYIGTLGMDYAGVKIDADLTTPTAIELGSHLEDMVQKGVKACAVEVSSIGLEQHRTDAIDFDVAIFTNFTHDHLDYHGTMENYFKAKKKLFDDLGYDTIAITNVDDEVGLDIVQDTKAKVITYGIENDADYMAKDIKLDAGYTQFVLVHADHSYMISTNLVATFNIYNLLAVLAALDQMGHDLEHFIGKLKTLKPVAGRMHKIDEGQDFTVIVDFAHTPDGLQKVFEYAQKITPSSKNIVAVFGSAGGRDRSKRKTFGELADYYCDKIVLTEDDPRDEDPYMIAKEIAEGIKRHEYIIVESREEAIHIALDMLNSKDTLLILGKGDEDFIYRDFGKEPYAGDDNIAIRYIRKMKEEKDNGTSEIYRPHTIEG